MLVKDIILKVCDFLENKELSQAILKNSLNSQQEEEVETLVKCLNLVRNEIATEMLPNVKLERVASQKGRIDFSSLSHQIIEILSVKDIFGNNAVYDVYSDHITTSETKVDIKYNANPEILAFEDEFFSTIPERVYAYGIVREYYYIQTLYEDAGVWEARFKNSIGALERKKSETVVLKRRWTY